MDGDSSRVRVNLVGVYSQYADSIYKLPVQNTPRQKAALRLRFSSRLTLQRLDYALTCCRDHGV